MLWNSLKYDENRSQRVFHNMGEAPGAYGSLDKWHNVKQWVLTLFSDNMIRAILFEKLLAGVSAPTKKSEITAGWCQCRIT